MDKQIDIKKALDERGGWQIWWRLLRPHTLTASFVPVFVGTMAALLEGFFHVDLFIAMLIASVLIQAATNMFNEYYDYKRGLDNEQSVGIGGTIVRDGIAPRTVMRLAITFIFAAILIGLYICLVTDWSIAVIGIICIFIGYIYTGGPFPIAYTPFGELVSGLLMGTVIIAISFYIQTGMLSHSVILISLPVAIFIGAILLANNIRDLDGDKRSGRKTIAILLGRKNAINFLACLFALAYGLTLLYILFGMLPAWSLITFLSLKKAIEVVKNFQGKTEPIEMMPAMVATGKTNTIYGFLLGVSLLLSSYL